MTTTVTLQRQSICAGGEHAVIRTTINGGPPKDYQVAVSDVLRPLSELTDDERRIILAGILQLHCRGLTRQQANAELVAGITIVI